MTFIPSHFERLSKDITAPKFNRAVQGLRDARFAWLSTTEPKSCWSAPMYAMTAYLTEKTSGKAVGTAL